MWSYVSLVNNIAISTYCDGVSIYYYNESLGEHLHLDTCFVVARPDGPRAERVVSGVNMSRRQHGHDVFRSCLA